MELIKEIDKNEYPPKYIGYKYDGTKKCVYRIDGDMGLVMCHNHQSRESWYEWEHFVKIKESK